MTFAAFDKSKSRGLIFLLSKRVPPLTELRLTPIEGRYFRLQPPYLTTSVPKRLSLSFILKLT